MFDYKLEQRVGQVVKVPLHHTSQICLCCIHQAKENRKIQSLFICEDCGHEANADDVGAINILAHISPSLSVRKVSEQDVFSVVSRGSRRECS